MLLLSPCSTDALNTLKYVYCLLILLLRNPHFTYVETLASSGCFWNTLSISSIVLHAVSIITCYAKVNTSPKCLQHHTITSNLFGQVTVAPFTLPFASAVATACAATGTESTHKIWVPKKESREVIKGCRVICMLYPKFRSFSSLIRKHWHVAVALYVAVALSVASA